MELSIPHPNQIASKKRGFTLIELIVVIAIIATLLAIGVGTIKNVAGAKGVSTGVSLAEGVFDHARNIAKNNGSARVLIYCDTGGTNKDKREKYLRYLAVAAPKLKPKNDPSDPDEIEWKIVSSGVSLPTDTFFNEKLSPGVQKDKAKFPGFKDKKECYFYEFNSEGALVSPATDGKFVIQAGKLIPGQDIPKKLPKRKRDVGGFRIWSSGKTSIFRSPNQISSSDEIDF